MIISKEMQFHSVIYSERKFCNVKWNSQAKRSVLQTLQFKWKIYSLLLMSKFSLNMMENLAFNAIAFIRSRIPTFSYIFLYIPLCIHTTSLLHSTFNRSTRFVCIRTPSTSGYLNFFLRFHNSASYKIF